MQVNALKILLIITLFVSTLFKIEIIHKNFEIDLTEILRYFIIFGLGVLS